MAQERQILKLLNAHFKSVENITDGRFVPYITGCVDVISCAFYDTSFGRIK
jgi:ABC-type siderophore export system fused ATPase/permease subunit